MVMLLCGDTTGKKISANSKAYEEQSLPTINVDEHVFAYGLDHAIFN